MDQNPASMVARVTSLFPPLSPVPAPQASGAPSARSLSPPLLMEAIYSIHPRLARGTKELGEPALGTIERWRCREVIAEVRVQ